VNGSAREWLRDFPCCIGQVLVQRGAAGAFVLSHVDDQNRIGLTSHHAANAAVEIARYDDAGEYRPLKTAPNLRHGWRLELPDESDVEQAIDFFYPGRLAALRAFRAGTLTTTPFRTTLERQTGMYRVAAKISDDQANELIGSFCRTDGGCLRTILWRRDAAGTVPSTHLPPAKYEPASSAGGVPLLCQEICNLLVAAARETVKSSAQ
jgi:sirohydrochlorin cobaltochelatase